MNKFLKYSLLDKNKNCRKKLQLKNLKDLGFYLQDVLYTFFNVQKNKKNTFYIDGQKFVFNLK